MKKPDSRIYQLTLDRYDVTAKNAVFIDDKKENIDAAIMKGIHGIHFTSAKKLNRELERLEVI